MYNKPDLTEHFHRISDKSFQYLWETKLFGFPNKSTIKNALFQIRERSYITSFEIEYLLIK